MIRPATLKFQCPQCGCRKFTEQGQCDYAESDVSEVVIDAMDNSVEPELKYLGHPRLCGDFEIESFQCTHCGFEIQDRDGNNIDSYGALADWLRLYPPRTLTQIMADYSEIQGWGIESRLTILERFMELVEENATTNLIAFLEEIVKSEKTD